MIKKKIKKKTDEIVVIDWTEGHEEYLLIGLTRPCATGGCMHAVINDFPR